MIQYRYGINGAGMLVDVLRLTEENRAVYMCPDCSGEFVLVLPTSDIAKHFRHKADSGCAGEGYLHKVAKQAFKQAYQFYASRDGFFIDIEKARIKISDIFRNVIIENKTGDRIPDITLLSNDGRKVFIEIFVTHRVNPLSAMMRYYPTIEIYIPDEDAVAFLKKDIIKLDSPNITCFNNGISLASYFGDAYFLTDGQWGYVERLGIDRLREEHKEEPSTMCALLELGLIENGRINTQKLQWIEEHYDNRT